MSSSISHRGHVHDTLVKSCAAAKSRDKPELRQDQAYAAYAADASYMSIVYRSLNRAHTRHPPNPKSISSDTYSSSPKNKATLVQNVFSSETYFRPKRIFVRSVSKSATLMEWSLLDRQSQVWAFSQ